MSTISMNKTYKTRDGRPVRVLCVDAKHASFPVKALIANESGQEVVVSLTATGKFFERSHTDSSIDLVECKPRVKRTLWLNLHKTGEVYAHPSKEAARDGRINSYGKEAACYLACVKVEIDCEEGEGLG